MLLHFDSFFVKVFIISYDDIINDTSVIVGDTEILHYVRNTTLTWLRKKICVFFGRNTESNVWSKWQTKINDVFNKGLAAAIRYNQRFY